MTKTESSLKFQCIFPKIPGTNLTKWPELSFPGKMPHVQRKNAHFFNYIGADQAIIVQIDTIYVGTGSSISMHARSFSGLSG